MKLAAPFALLLVAGLVACGSPSVDQRTAIAQFVRASATRSGATHVKISGIKVSRIDSRYGVAQEQYTSRRGRPSYATWILRRDGSTWRPTSVENMFPVCSAAPATIRKELAGTAFCYPPVGVYTSIPWTRGKSVRLRYCERPGGPGNFIAASQGVSCQTAALLVYSNRKRCDALASCEIAGFQCRAYWNGRYGRTFRGVDHALCTDGPRRVEWDGG
ncbi:MAG: hypothetical protein QOG85_2600 [Gaiellaceae bacterium]|jgi:hypothetical protein|nr:hypothetical protein [Gaiellaceae bacterium]